MTAALIIALAVTIQVPVAPKAKPAPAPVVTETERAQRAERAQAERARLIAKRKAQASNKRITKGIRAFQANAAQVYAQREAERLAPIRAMEAATAASAAYQHQAGQALNNIGIAARQNAETNRLRELNRNNQNLYPGVPMMGPTVGPTQTPGQLIAEQSRPPF